MDFLQDNVWISNQKKMAFTTGNIGNSPKKQQFFGFQQIFGPLNCGSGQLQVSADLAKIYGRPASLGLTRNHP
jgi:hypothetical protein